MKLSEWASRKGISYRTAWRWFKEGKLPVYAEQMVSGTILVKEDEPISNQVVIYARVSSSDQKQDLDRQIARLVTFANSNKWMVVDSVTEIGPKSEWSPIKTDEIVDKSRS